MDRAATFVNSVLIILVSFGRVAVKDQVTASRSMCPRGWSEDSMRVVDIYARVSCIRSLSTSGSDQLRYLASSTTWTLCSDRNAVGPRLPTGIFYCQINQSGRFQNLSLAVSFWRKSNTKSNTKAENKVQNQYTLCSEKNTHLCFRL